MINISGSIQQGFMPTGLHITGFLCQQGFIILLVKQEYNCGDL